MKPASIFVRMLRTARHPRLEGVVLRAGERYSVKIPDAEALLAALEADLDHDISAPGVDDVPALVARLREIANRAQDEERARLEAALNAAPEG